MGSHTTCSALLAAGLLIAGTGCRGSEAQQSANPEAPLGSIETVRRIIAAIPPPPGFERRSPPLTPFGRWLAERPLLPGRPQVLLFDGTPKRNQQAHFAVLDLDVGERNLQQCADAALRLRAEFLWQSDCRDEIEFRFTSGDAASWADWRAGLRPKVSGNRVEWVQSAAEAAHADYKQFRRYLDVVFQYAGTASLARDLHPLDDPRRIQPGDMFLQGGFPGHAVIVLDRVENDAGEAKVLLGQSYMPAQQMHVLRRPQAPDDPWYPVRSDGILETPEWTFQYSDAVRFPPLRCDRMR